MTNIKLDYKEHIGGGGEGGGEKFTGGVKQESALINLKIALSDIKFPEDEFKKAQGVQEAKVGEENYQKVFDENGDSRKDTGMRFSNDVRLKDFYVNQLKFQTEMVKYGDSTTNNPFKLVLDASMKDKMVFQSDADVENKSNAFIDAIKSFIDNNPQNKTVNKLATQVLQQLRSLTKLEKNEEIQKKIETLIQTIGGQAV